MLIVVRLCSDQIVFIASRDQEYVARPFVQLCDPHLAASTPFHQALSHFASEEGAAVASMDPHQVQGGLLCQGLLWPRCSSVGWWVFSSIGCRLSLAFCKLAIPQVVVFNGAGGQYSRIPNSRSHTRSN